MTSFADINWRQWQQAEPKVLADVLMKPVYNALCELERRVAALEAKQPREEEAPIGIPFTWSNVDALSVGCDYNLNN